MKVSGPEYPRRTPYWRLVVIYKGSGPGYDCRSAFQASAMNGDDESVKGGRDTSTRSIDGLVFGRGGAGEH